MKKIILPILPFLLILMLMSLACSAPIKAANSTSEQGAELTVTGPQLTLPAEKTSQPATDTTPIVSQDGTVTTITISESQINANVQKQLANHTDIPLKNPQVTLSDDVINVSGELSVGPITSKATIVMQPYVDNGHLRIKIQSAQLGSMPFPDSTLKSLDETLNQNMDQLVSQNKVEFTVESVAVSDGKMTITGTSK